MVSQQVSLNDIFSFTFETDYKMFKYQQQSLRGFFNNFTKLKPTLLIKTLDTGVFLVLKSTFRRMFLKF